MKAEIKKTRTKKELKNYYAQFRSSVGQGQRLGTLSHKSAKNYDRKKLKLELSKRWIGED